MDLAVVEFISDNFKFYEIGLKVFWFLP